MEHIAELLNKHANKQAEISNKHQRVKSRSQLLFYALVVGWLFIILGLATATLTLDDRIIPLGITVFLLGILLAWVGDYKKKKLPNFDKDASEEWTSFFASWELLTPAGERCVCQGADFDGTRLYVSYDDGNRDQWPIWLLRNTENQYYRSSQSFGGDAGMLVRMSKCKWRTRDGRVGTVRNARSVYEEESRLTLAFPGGEVSDFKLSELEPATGLGMAA